MNLLLTTRLDMYEGEGCRDETTLVAVVSDTC